MTIFSSLPPLRGLPGSTLVFEKLKKTVSVSSSKVSSISFRFLLFLLMLDHSVSIFGHNIIIIIIIIVIICYKYAILYLLVVSGTQRLLEACTKAHLFMKLWNYQQFISISNTIQILLLKFILLQRGSTRVLLVIRIKDILK